MSGLEMQDIAHDRGLGSAYERYCFYQKLDAWAAEYGIESVLEGPVDGMAGVAGVHGLGLARRGIAVTSAVSSEAKRDVARALYDRIAPGSLADVRVVTNDSFDALPQSDLVIAYHSLPLVGDWRAYLRAAAAMAKKALIVTVCNPRNWGVTLIRTIGALRGIRGLDPPDVWHTETLGPALWEVGRVREHAYFDVPWWPDLQVSAGQSLADRARQLFRQKKGNVEFTASSDGVALAEKFVYGADRWPYFGGPGWVDELFPALLRHPGFDGTKSRFEPYLAHLHAFVVDCRPRTPQAKRKLAAVR
jgi:hypothetical protein